MSSLAAARADNFYYPPEWTPSKGSINKFQGQHPLRARARKIDQGILVIRFEMPFNVWCGGCKDMIAKGVRFNAEKKHIGNYLSTKIWSFKMKSACCGNEIEIVTDPKNCDYKVVSGAEKKMVEFDANDAETLLLQDSQEKEKLADPLFNLEHTNEDIMKAKDYHPIIAKLKKDSDLKHSDPYKQNRALRDQFRKQKKVIAEEEAYAQKIGFFTRLLPASEEDKKTITQVKFHPKFNSNLREKRAIIQASSIFSPSSNLLGIQNPNKSLHGSAIKHKSGSDKNISIRAPGCINSSVSNDKKLSLIAKRNRMDVLGACKLINSGFDKSKKSRVDYKSCSASRVSVNPT